MLCWGEVKQEGGYLIDLMRKTFIYMKLEIFLSISYLKLSINNFQLIETIQWIWLLLLEVAIFYGSALYDGNKFLSRYLKP